MEPEIQRNKSGLWDDTNVNFDFKPSDAYEQRVTYSSYYCGNCATSGVFFN